MAVSSQRRKTEQFQIPSKYRDNQTSQSGRKVSVVYYLSRDGHLEHPHFMEVSLSSNEGLYLKDVIDRLSSLRGKGMANLYSWSSKRSYKNGFVWHDLGESDFICPAHGHDYVLKGSEIPQTSIKSEEEELKLRENCEFPILIRRRNQSWSSLDLNEYKVYKSDSHGEYALKAADASTQTDEKRRTIQENDEQVSGESLDSQTTELSREEISPPPSSSSPETLETLIKADGCISRSELHDPTDDIHPNTKAKASTVLKQFLSCGPFSSRDAGKDQGFSLVSHYESRLPRGPRTSKGDDSLMGTPNFAGMSLEDKEYFSGSLIETKKEEFAIFKRSSSYNADRSSKLELREKEIEGVRAKCIPRRPKNKKESKEVSRASSQQGSKRHGDEEPDK